MRLGERTLLQWSVLARISLRMALQCSSYLLQNFHAPFVSESRILLVNGIVESLRTERQYRCSEEWRGCAYLESWSVDDWVKGMNPVPVCFKVSIFVCEGLFIDALLNGDGFCAGRYYKLVLLHVIAIFWLWVGHGVVYHSHVRKRAVGTRTSARVRERVIVCTTAPVR